MKNVGVTAYVAFNHYPDMDTVIGLLRSQLARYGYQIRQHRFGQQKPTSQFYPYAPFNKNYDRFVTLYLSVPNNASVNAVRVNFINALRAYGKIVGSYGQLGESLSSAQGANDSQITVNENDVAVDEISEQSSEFSGGGILLVGLGLVAGYVLGKDYFGLDI